MIEDSTRNRLIAAMVDGLRTRGYHGVGIAELLDKSRTPKGVLYHHFPGGKSELATEAIRAVALQLSSDLQGVIQRSDKPLDAMTMWMNSALKQLQKSGFQAGCPLATVGLESTPEDLAIRAALNQAFTVIRSQVKVVLTTLGLPENPACKLAALIVSAYEGALLQARVAQDTSPMRETIEALIGLVRLSVPNVGKPTGSLRTKRPIPAP